MRNKINIEVGGGDLLDGEALRAVLVVFNEFGDGSLVCRGIHQQDLGEGRDSGAA